MSKFKKAIEQINKPIEEQAKQQGEVKAAENVTEPAEAIEEAVVLEPVITEPSEPANEIKDIRGDSKQKPKKEKAPKPEKVKKEKKPKKGKKAKRKGKKRGKLKITLIVFAVLVALVLFGGLYNYNLNNQLRPTFYQIQSGKVVDNVRVVAIADLHLKEFGENNVRLVEKIESYHPDIIAIVGDMNMEEDPDYSVVVNLCARLNEVAPVYYALGNHEIDAMLFRDSQIYYDLKSLGINILNNETETVEVGLSKIDIIGLTQNPKEFREYGKKFFDAAMSANENFKLVLTHYPENFDGVIEDYPIDLAISGHAHGGLVRLPFIGGVYSADQGVLPELYEGYHELGNSKLIITRGLGKSGLFPRVNNAPEITIVDINWY